jgi:hypothetical protein
MKPLETYLGKLCEKGYTLFREKAFAERPEQRGGIPLVYC